MSQLIKMIIFLLLLGWAAQVSAESQYIRNWLLCGPFPGETLFSEAPDESVQSPEPGELFREKEWRKHGFVADILNLEEEGAFGYVDTCVGYAFVKIISPKEQYAQLRFGSDDGIRVWFNGSEVLANGAKRPLRMDEERVIIVLEEGENRLLLKIWDFYAGYGFSARICQPDGAAIEGLRFIPEKNNLRRAPVKRVVASSVQSGDMRGFNPLYAADGHGRTRWSSSHYDPQWIRLDFAEAFDLYRLDIDWETAYSKQYSVDVSQDARIWQTIYETERGRPGHKTLWFDPPVRANYVRLFSTRKATPWGNSIWELTAYGLPLEGHEPISWEEAISHAVGEIIQPVVVKDVSASSIQPEYYNHEEKRMETYDPQNAVDHNLRTRWSSLHQDPQWLTLDLGTEKEFSELRIMWETAYASQYKIEVSDKGITWEEIYNKNGGDGMMDVIVFNQPVTARYIRLYGLERATVWGYSIWEFWVF